MTSSAVSITDSFFDNVSCTGGGGIIWAISNSLVVLNSIQQTCESRIISTSSFKVQGTIIEMFNSSFFGCTSSTDGSIVQSYDNAIVNVSKSTFSSLSSLGYGGAIASFGSYVTVSDTLFRSCVSFQGGGAIWSSSFQAFYGGNNTADTSLQIRFSRFEYCQTDARGGAVFATSDAATSSTEIVDIDIRQSEFLNCTSKLEGGAISISGGIVKASIIECTLKSCTSLTSGGAVAVNNMAKLALNNIVVRECSSSVSGGALAVSAGATTLLSNSSIIMCQSFGAGGGVSSTDKASLSLVSSTFRGNSVGGLGGGALRLENSYFSIFDCILENNTATQGGGGAIFWQGKISPVTKFDCPLSTNFSIVTCSLSGPAWNSDCILGTCTAYSDPNDYATSSGAFDTGLQLPVSLLVSLQNSQRKVSCTMSNNAKYGPCIASEYKRFLVLGGTTEISPAYPGLPLSLVAIKKDAYNQTVSSDSSSIIQVFNSMDGTLKSDPAVSFAGATITKMVEGQAFFSFALKPTFSVIDFVEAKTSLKTIPYLYFSGSDLGNDRILDMISNIFSVAIAKGSQVCPSGYVLALDSDRIMNGSASCKFCPSGTYSVNPLAWNPSSTSRAPSCLNCPVGGNCNQGGGNIIFAIGNWTVLNGIYVVTACPFGHQLINSTTGTRSGLFSHDVQQCKSCPPGTYIIDPNAGLCQTCPTGAVCAEDLSCAFNYPPSFKCPLSGKIVGLWEIDHATNAYVIQSCPAGYALESTSEAGSPDLQRCKSCTAGQYIINPNTDSCQQCPPGIHLQFLNCKMPSI